MEINRSSVRIKIADVDTNVDKIINKRLAMIDALLGLKKENIPKVCEMIEKSGEDISYIIGMLKYFICIRVEKRESFIEVIKRIDKTSNDEKDDLYFNIQNIDEAAEAILKDDEEKFKELMKGEFFSSDATYALPNPHVIRFAYEDDDEELTYTELAAFLGSAKCFKLALSCGIEGLSLEKFAVAGGNFEIIHALEKSGQSFDDCFEVAVQYHRDSICQWLLDNYKCQTTPSMAEECYNERILNFFLLNKINVTQEELSNALNAAASNGNIQVVKYFIENEELSVDSKDEKGNTPLINAAINDSLPLMKYLIEEYKASVNEQGEEENTALHYISEHSDFDAVKYLVEKCGARCDIRNSFEWLPMHFAAQSGCFDIVYYFIEKCGADVNQKDENGWNMLTFAANSGNLEMAKYVYEKCHAAANTKNENGWIALHMASDKGFLPLVKYLVEVCHENVNEKNIDGFTPLHCAAQMGNVDVVKYLIENCGANPNEKDNYEMTPYDVATSLVKKYLDSKK